MRNLEVMCSLVELTQDPMYLPYLKLWKNISETKAFSYQASVRARRSRSRLLMAVKFSLPPGTLDISPRLQTVAGPCRLRNIRAQVMPDEETFARPGTACADDRIVLGNPFLVRAGPDVKEFVTKNLEKLSYIDYGEIRHVEAFKVGKLGSRIIANQCCSQQEHGPRVCSLMENGDIPLKDGDEIYYKDVAVGKQEKSDLDEAIFEMGKRACKKLPKNVRPSLEALVLDFKDMFRKHLGADPPVDFSPMEI